MKLVLSVALFRLAAALAAKKKNEKNKMANEGLVNKIQHPAEFALR